MRVFLPRSVQREADRDGLTDENCREAIRKAEDGLVDAELGAGIIKQRIARGNRGAAKGSRAVIFYRRTRIAIFLHIFPKNRKANLSQHELDMYMRAAHDLAKLSESELELLMKIRGWKELKL